jgi:hypothetical protein
MPKQPLPFGLKDFFLWKIDKLREDVEGFREDVIAFLDAMEAKAERDKKGEGQGERPLIPESEGDAM